MTWNKGNPAAGIVARQLDNDIRENNAALETVVNFGHDLVTTETGWHNTGSAQMYSGSSTPTTKEDGLTALTAVDFHEKIWVNETTTPAIVSIYTAASTWTPLAQLIGMIDDDTLATASDVLPASSESIKAYVDNEQIKDIKKDGTVAFTGDQSMGGNKLTSVDDPTSSDDAATKAYVDSLKINATNTYAGDGTSSKSISGLGFQPDYIMIIPESTQATHVKTSNMGATSAQNLTANGFKNDDSITSIDSDGFTVGDGTGGGSNDNMNKSGENYFWIATKNN